MDTKPESIIEQAGPTLASLFRNWGLEYALALAHDLIKRIKPISLIHCLIRNRDDMSTYVFAEMGEGQKVVSYSMPDVYTMINAPADPLDDYVVSDMENDQRFSQFFDPVARYHSMVRVRLFEEGRSVCFLGLWAKEVGVFSKEDIAWVGRLVQALGEALHTSLLTDATLLPVLTMNTLPDANLLRMCTGLKNALERMDKAARTDSTVLITGETGSGKGVMAHAIHELSARLHRPFITVNCGAIPPSLLESELFGHERGAFTGAVSQHKGVFEQANGGTIFLDEIGELPLLAQTRLLHVLDQHEITRIGGMRRISLNIRVLAATHRDLRDMVRQGAFREDLYYRLSVYPIHMPPLRERKEDILILARHFTVTKAKEIGIDTVSYPSQEEMESLCAYEWPGNVRELEHTVERALIDARTSYGMRPIHFEPGTGAGLLSPRMSETLQNEEAWPSLDENVKNYLCKVLKKTGGRIYGHDGAAALLQIHPNTLKNKMLKLGISMNKLTTVHDGNN